MLQRIAIGIVALVATGTQSNAAIQAWCTATTGRVSFLVSKSEQNPGLYKGKVVALLPPDILGLYRVYEFGGFRSTDWVIDSNRSSTLFNIEANVSLVLTYHPSQTRAGDHVFTLKTKGKPVYSARGKITCYGGIQ